MKPIEETLADFLLQMRDARMQSYRQRCLEHWREHYGPVIAAKVEAMVRERWNAKPKPQAKSS